MNKVDILAIGVHPDDVELGCGGTLIKEVKNGRKVGICDLTQGELGTRGSGALRLKEAEAAREIIGADFRVNLGLPDGFIENDKASQLKIIEVLRACTPDVVICNAPEDRHPDHGRSSDLEKVACFLSGLRRIETSIDGVEQSAWRPKVVLHYIQDRFLVPNIVVDVTDFWDQRMEAIQAFSSQFYDPKSNEPESAISSKAFLELQRGRGLQMGRYIGATLGEGFISERPLGAEGLFSNY
ncbi:MAG TPA: bacillithiol biosynthesis deacetylase BshB1 [Flavobacteriales bacterium]|nr:bacillithiol biosynthesis deacetylase BshB1 [Flavobacteriales bacterium]HAW19454.1 bacillithiol biosynthesis deacetylase BshB1 [Flavobacteriales bacterium]